MALMIWLAKLPSRRVRGTGLMRAELKANDEFRDHLLHQYPWNRTPLPALSHLPVYPEVSSPTLDTIQDYLAAHSHESGSILSYLACRAKVANRRDSRCYLSG